MSDKVYRTVSITMEATAENFTRLRTAIRELPQGWIYQDSLSKNPEPGETWKDGNGHSVVLKANPASSDCVDDRHPLSADDTCNTWRANGWWHNDMWNRQNLVERVSECPKIEIKDGEYWMDRDGRVHHVSVDSTGTYCVSANEGDYLLTWTIAGYYTDRNSPHHRDLIKKMVFAEDCNK
jgi:hypothetical protein